MTPEERFDATVPADEQDDVLTRIVEAGYGASPGRGLMIYSIDGHGLDGKQIIGSIEIGEDAYEFEIMDGPGYGTEIRDWTEL